MTLKGQVHFLKLTMFWIIFLNNHTPVSSPVELQETTGKHFCQPTQAQWLPYRLHSGFTPGNRRSFLQGRQPPVQGDRRLQKEARKSPEGLNTLFPSYSTTSWHCGPQNIKPDQFIARPLSLIVGRQLGLAKWTELDFTLESKIPYMTSKF